MYENKLSEFIKLYDKLSSMHNKVKVFSDFVKMSSIAMYNSFAKNQEMEKEYLRIINSYEKEERDIFPQMFSELAMSYEKTTLITDLLGPLYESKYISDSHLGQVFTPAHVSNLMAEISIGRSNSLQETINKNGYVTVSDPACGAGRTITFICKSNTKKKFKLSTKFISYSK